MLQSTVSQSRSSYNSKTIASKHKYISDSQLTECKPFSGKNEVTLTEPTDPIITVTGELFIYEALSVNQGALQS